MFDRELAVEQLSLIELAAERVQRRIEGLDTPNDLIATEEGQLRFDGILMMIVAIGEQLKKMDKHVPADFSRATLASTGRRQRACETALATNILPPTPKQPSWSRKIEFPSYSK